MLIDVEADGRRSAEMHVDGGVTTNVLILPEALLVSGTAVFPPDARPKVYVVMNSKLAPDFEVVKASRQSFTGGHIVAQRVVSSIPHLWPSTFASQSGGSSSREYNEHEGMIRR